MLNEQSNLAKVINMIDVFSGTPTQATNIVEAIEQDHKDLKKFIRLLKDEKTSPGVKRKVYCEFASLLTSHSSAEEKAMYAISEKLSGLKQKTLEGYVEHSVASALVKKISRDPSAKQLSNWLAQVQVLAELVEHHVQEEESDLLPQVKKQLSEKKQFESCRKFVKLRRASQKNPPSENSGVLT